MKIKKRTMFAITDGLYKGDFIVFMTNKPNNGLYNVINLPSIAITSIPENEIHEGIRLKILDYVDRLSRTVYNELEQQVKIKNMKMFDEQLKVSDEYNNRREQFTTSGVLDVEEDKGN